MINFKELRQASGMSQTKFAEYFNIPRRTVQNWELGTNKCPEYLLDLMEYKLNNEKKMTKEDVVKIIKEHNYEMMCHEWCAYIKDETTGQEYIVTLNEDDENEIYWIAKRIN